MNSLPKLPGQVRCVVGANDVKPRMLRRIFDVVWPSVHAQSLFFLSQHHEKPTQRVNRFDHHVIDDKLSQASLRNAWFKSVHALDKDVFMSLL